MTRASGERARLSQEVAGDAHIRTPEHEFPVAAHQVQDAERCGEALGEDRRDGGSAGAHGQHADQEVIHDQVQNSGARKDEQRNTRVPDGAKEAVVIVVEVGQRESGQDQGQVPRHVQDHVSGRLHNADQGRKGEQAAR